jgi:hypothetical protein
MRFLFISMTSLLVANGLLMAEDPVMTSSSSTPVPAASTPTPVAVAAPPPAGPRGDLPPSIIATLDREYPGWVFARSSRPVLDQFAKHPAGHPPYLVGGDFDDDGAKDYAVQIARTQPGDEEQIVIAFLRRDDVFEEIILESRGLDSNVYLWTRRRPRPDAASFPAARRMQLLIVVMGSEAGDSTYNFEDGTFHQVDTRFDSPEPTGDSSSQ